MSLSIIELITLWECRSIFLFIFQPSYRRTKMILLSRWAVLAPIPCLPPSYFWHRIFSWSWETIYSLVSKPHFERRLNLIQSSSMVWHLTLDFPLVWIMARIISCSSRTSLYINTKSSGSTSLCTTCDVGPILSTWERLVATSCYWQIQQIVPVYTIFYMHESWVRIMQTWSIPGLGCRTMRPAAWIFYGCDGMRLIRGLQNGLISHCTQSASHSCVKMIPLALWIRMTCCVSVISFRPLQKANERKLKEMFHVVLKIAKTMWHTMLAGRFWQFYWGLTLT